MGDSTAYKDPTTNPQAPAQAPPPATAAPAQPPPKGPAPAVGSGLDPNFSNRGADMGALRPMSYGELAALYQDPNAAANASAINTGYGQTLQGYGPGGKNLAGVTQLGMVQNAGAAGIDTGQSNNLLGGQLSNINQLNAQAQGLGPSLAQEQARQQTEANIAGQMGMAGAQRGSSNTALGLRSAQVAAAQAQQQGMQAGVQGRLQEELSARQQLTQALSGTQGQVMQGAQAQAGLQQQANMQNAQAGNQAMMQQGQMNQETKLANLQAMLQAGQINMGQYNAMLQAQLQQSNNQMTANMNLGGTLVGENTSLEGISSGIGINDANNAMGLASAGIGAASAGAAAAIGKSDRRAKKGVRPAARSLKGFLSQIADGPVAASQNAGFAFLTEI